jgi:hypothetical protein
MVHQLLLDLVRDKREPIGTLVLLHRAEGKWGERVEGASVEGEGRDEEDGGREGRCGKSLTIVFCVVIERDWRGTSESRGAKRVRREKEEEEGEGGFFRSRCFRKSTAVWQFPSSSTAASCRRARELALFFSLFSTKGRKE